MSERGIATLVTVAVVLVVVIAAGVSYFFITGQPGPGAPQGGIMYEVYPETDQAPVLEFFWGPPELQLSQITRVTPYGCWEGPPEALYEPAVEMQFYTTTSHDPVYAVAKGTVVSVDRDYKTFSIRYGRNYGVTYHHVDDILDNVTPGAKVEAGTLVGYTENLGGEGWWEIELNVKRDSVCRTTPPFGYFSAESQAKLQSILEASPTWEVSGSPRTWTVTTGEDCWTKYFDAPEWWSGLYARLGYMIENFETEQDFLAANNLTWDQENGIRPVDSQGEGPIIFTCLPLNENDYNEIYPLGSLSPPGHTFPTDHVYFKLTTPWTYPPPYQVKAPADGTITEIYYSQYDWPEGSGHSGKYNDYCITITHTSTFKTKFGHLSELENWVLEQAGTLELGWNLIETPVPVSVGDVVGRLAGQGGVQGDLDMWAIDEEVTLNFIHPEKFSYGAHAVCPLDYFEDNLKAALYQKVSRTAEPRCGKIDFDQPGKLVGNWFLENTTEPLGEWEKHLVFVYDRDDPTQIRISLGGTLPITVGVYEVEGNSPDPAEVSVENGIIVYRLSGTTNWEGETATILAQVVDNERIKVEAFDGHPPDPTFTSNAKYYTR
jgi:hypothetical protein